jgi:hypothetical protein
MQQSWYLRYRCRAVLAIRRSFLSIEAPEAGVTVGLRLGLSLFWLTHVKPVSYRVYGSEGQAGRTVAKWSGLSTESCDRKNLRHSLPTQLASSITTNYAMLMRSASIKMTAKLQSAGLCHSAWRHTEAHQFSFSSKESISSVLPFNSCSWTWMQPAAATCKGRWPVKQNQVPAVRLATAALFFCRQTQSLHSTY